MLDARLIDRRWSDIARVALVACVIGAVLLSLADGLVYAYYMTASHNGFILALKTWVTDFRYFTEQGIYAATILLVGAKFFETRTVLTIAFDRLEHGRISLRGPDGDNTVWIGRRYDTRMEGEAVLSAMQSRLRSSVET